MKRIILFVLLFILLISCVQSKQYTEDPAPAPNRINRDGVISFMGLRLGLSNDSVKIILQSSENLIIREFPNFYSRNSQSVFDVWDEDQVNSFFCSIVDTNNESHGGWGKVKSDVDSVTTIYFYIPTPNETDSVFELLKPLFVERYGDPDEEYDFDEVYEIINNMAVLKEEAQTKLYDGGCYWDFVNDQRIYLNKKKYLGRKHGDIFRDVEHIEIVYRDMKVVKRIEEAQRLRQQQEEKKEKEAEEERIKENKKRREEQQL